MKLILASSSPRRRELLSQLNVEFTVVEPNIIEQQNPNETAHNFVKRMAQEKANEVAKKFPNSLVIGSDTIVVIFDENNEHILGKPTSNENAEKMLKSLSGRKHTVLSAVALVCTTKNISYCEIDEAEVTMRRLTDLQISTYVQSGEPNGKAGAYAIQGEGGRFVSNVYGELTTVIGLPLQLTGKLLAKVNKIPLY